MVRMRMLAIMERVTAAVLVCTGVGAAATTWYVDDGVGAGIDFTKIQDAVDAASEGATIRVGAGTYNENVDVNRRLTLIGEGADVVTVTAASADNHVFEVTVDCVNISGFTVTGASRDQTPDRTPHTLNTQTCKINETGKTAQAVYRFC